MFFFAWVICITTNKKTTHSIKPNKMDMLITKVCTAFFLEKQKSKIGLPVFLHYVFMIRVALMNNSTVAQIIATNNREYYILAVALNLSLTLTIRLEA